MRDLESFNAPISTHASSFLFVRSRARFESPLRVPAARARRRRRRGPHRARVRARHSSPRIEPRARGSERNDDDDRADACVRARRTPRAKRRRRGRARARDDRARRERRERAMGKGTAEPRVRINTKSAGRGKRRDVACLNEMFTLLTCYKTNNFEEGKCASARRALDSCLELRAKAPKKMNTINHHLNRLIRLTKK